ncbi:MAG: TetR/AcrR family transcriptional regulator [Micrococcales bacterium]
MNPQPKQSRAQETVAALIQTTNAVMAEGGESAVRIQEISVITGVSIGSIYHHFGDREGLIRATHVHNFSATVRKDIERVKEWMSQMHSTTEIAAHYNDMMKFLVAHFAAQSPFERAAILGNTAGRPLLQKALAEVQHELTNSLTEAMQLLKDRGMLKAHLSARAAAVVILGMLFGRVIGELDLTPVKDEEWNQSMLSAFSGLFQLATQLGV